ncbi:putative phage Mu protein gp47-like protein [Desulfitobacterium dehalogenans ATCC 51507]|uniref:Putative phage Mu protein gp47-like protein n=1 Tax=Desulfitobacterium dehalogenans (strain ATCC 51507 / DSM 9161 / JW/IU-DC1) TaxID=756499 RepID=I4A6F0_DESDJ|nr:baseplate J/gp47 family protein [Desulfitobacterium dehalogenans]AFL99534.1 putative phage Mu protein gp47-like protein [Desulfitobacterium dehalogenans ATCC 51507]
MYENQTYDTILARMLTRVPNTVDKREGSLIFDALAPAAAELAQAYAELDINNNLIFADTASEEYLTRRAAEFGINRKEATKARRRGEFFDNTNAPLNIPIGSRYSIGGLNYTAIEQISTGVFALECETSGTAGNRQFGTLLPITYVNDLARAELTDVLVPGEDEETDEALRSRYYETVNEPAFGGNIADYKQKINAINGVGGTKVFPTWAGGGTVKCTIIAADWEEPSPALVEEVQTIIDPEENQGEGLGQAPIGHAVTISGVDVVTVNVETTLTLAPGVTPGQVQSDVEAVIEAYLLEQRKTWAAQTQIIVRTAQIDARMLTVQGVEDVSGTMLNGVDANLVLDEEEIPSLGTVVINE